MSLKVLVYASKIRPKNHMNAVEILGRIQITKDCWEWTGAHTSGGYAHAIFDGKNVSVHRWMYEFLTQPIAKDLHIDHLCRNRGCVNPDHMEPVTPRENVIRGDSPALAAIKQLSKTHCPQGHEYNNENTYVHPITRGRNCKECRRIRGRNLYWSRKCQESS